MKKCMTTCDKIAYDTYNLAIGAVKGIGKAKRGSMKVYKCECGKYHLATIGKRHYIPDVHPKLSMTAADMKKVKIGGKGGKQKSLELSKGRIMTKEQAERLMRLFQPNTS